MAASFSVSQYAYTPYAVVVTDTSSGLSGTITQRRLFISDAYGNYLTGDGTVNYNSWALADSSITYSPIQENLAALIKVQWLDAGNNVVDEVENTYPLCQQGKQFLYYLVGLQGLTPGIYQDTNYSGNIAIFWTNLIAGINAIEFGNDLAAAQNCFDRCTEMQNDQNKYF